MSNLSNRLADIYTKGQIDQRVVVLQGAIDITHTMVESDNTYRKTVHSYTKTEVDDNTVNKDDKDR